jgi:putative acetyltransferase
VVVLGHAEYYPRFGFERASLQAIRSQWDGIPNDAFLVPMLDCAAMTGVSGIARFRKEFDLTVRKGHYGARRMHKKSGTV